VNKARTTTPNKELHNMTALRVILIHFSIKTRSKLDNAHHRPEYNQDVNDNTFLTDTFQLCVDIFRGV
jgi:hypothetical protein